MAFDTKRFSAEQFKERTSSVEVPSLKDFFDDGEECKFLVKGLTGAEIGRANEAQQRSKNIEAIISGLASDSGSEKATALKQSLGLADNVPLDIVRRHEILFLGCVDPVLTLEDAVKIADAAPVDFYALTNEILKLSGQGKEPGKPKASGKKKTSG